MCKNIIEHVACRFNKPINCLQKFRMILVLLSADTKTHLIIDYLQNTENEIEHCILAYLRKLCTNC